MKFLYVLILVSLASCGGGNDVVDQPTSPAALAPPIIVPIIPPVATLPTIPSVIIPTQTVFEDSWGFRDLSNYVKGTISAPPNMDCSKPQAIANNLFTNNTISTNWGTLLGNAGDSLLADVTGTGNQYWHVENNKLIISAGAVRPSDTPNSGYALISGPTFNRLKPIYAEATMQMTDGGLGAFMGITFIAGEGNYREIVYRMMPDGLEIRRNAPCEETTIMKVDKNSVHKLALYYSETSGWTYLVDDVPVLNEPIDQNASRLLADPHVGLYFVSEGVGITKGIVGKLTVKSDR